MTPCSSFSFPTPPGLEADEPQQRAERAERVGGADERRPQGSHLNLQRVPGELLEVLVEKLLTAGVSAAGAHANYSTRVLLKQSGSDGDTERQHVGLCETLSLMAVDTVCV